jgi:hypothetical protein
VRFVLLAALCFLIPTQARAWGERGHNAIARVAAMELDACGLGLSEKYREKDAEPPGPEGYFRGKALELGHLANIPDISWRKLGPEVQALNAPTHFLNADNWTDDMLSLPLDYADEKKSAEGKLGRFDHKPIDAFESGTLIWRAQQFYDLMAASYKKASGEAPGSKEFVADVQQALVYGGLMAHFIGDASQPFHNTFDHDGYGTGEGGIHSYFETAVLNEESPKLELDVFAEAPKMCRKYNLWDKMDAAKKSGKPGAFMARALAADAYAKLKDLRADDDSLIVVKSTTAADGKPIPAKRVSPLKAEPKLEPLIEEQLSLSAATLAMLWRSAWEEGGKPDLSKAGYGDYALEPPFVVPDYDPDAVARLRAEVKAKAEKKN